MARGGGWGRQEPLILMSSGEAGFLAGMTPGMCVVKDSGCLVIKNTARKGGQRLDTQEAVWEPGQERGYLGSYAG